jgi:hypothetical protein
MTSDLQSAFRIGERAARRREPRSSCPFTDDRRAAWRNGWLAGVREWLGTPEAEAFLDAWPI